MANDKRRRELDRLHGQRQHHASDVPANAVVVYPGTSTTPSTIFVGTDVGVFTTSSTAPSWTEVGPNPNGSQTGFLPNVAVTALGIFSSGSQQLLRASTYGRGVWQFNLNPAPDFQLTVTPSTQTVALSQTATYSGTANFLNGYGYSVTLNCVAELGGTAPPSVCNATPPLVSSGASTFTLAASGPAGDYYFNVQGTGSDPANITHTVPLVLHITQSVNGPDFAMTDVGIFPIVKAGSVTTSGAFSISALNGFSGTVTLSCSLPGASCSLSNSAVSTFPVTVIVTVNATNLSAGSYQLSVLGTSGSISHTLPIGFNVTDYQLSGTQSLTIAPGTQGTANLVITPLNSYTGQLQATCNVSALTLGTCSFSLGNPIIVSGTSSIPLAATIGVGGTAPGTYDVNINTQDISVGDNNGQPVHNLSIAVTVPSADFTLTPSTQSQTVTAGQSANAIYNFALAPNPPGSSFTAPISLACPQLPSGAQCTFNQSMPVLVSTSPLSMTISTSATTPPGTYPLTVTATSGAISHSVSAVLIVAPAPALDFTLKASPASSTAEPGTPAAISLTLTSTAKSAIQVAVNCDDTSLPGAQGCSTFNPPGPFSLNPGASVQFTASINIPTNATPQEYGIVFTAQDSAGSQTVMYPLTIIATFSLTNATPTQTITQGQTTGAYQLSVAPNPPGSAFSGAVTLSCGFGLPPGAQCLFSPSTPVTPGSTAVNVVMTISTTTSASRLRRPGKGLTYFYAFALVLPGIVIAWGVARPKRNRSRKFILLAILSVSAMGLLSCGGGSSSPTGATGALTTAGNYTITVTGTSGSLSSSTSIGLIVEAP